MKLITVSEIINRAAVESGINPTVDPVGSQDENFVQLRYLLDSAGQELAEYKPWQALVRELALETKEGDSGDYVLPDDFLYMVDQSGWEVNENNPMGGPLNSQDWAYLRGRDMANTTIYASFRINENKLRLYPQPPPVGLDISFEYVSRAWLASQADQTIRFDTVQSNSDVCLLNGLMVIKFLKVKFLETKGLDSTAARMEFENVFGARKGHDEGGKVLSASGNGRSYPYLNNVYNTPATGLGK